MVSFSILFTISATVLWKSPDAPVLAIYLALITTASIFKVKLPGMTGTISPGFVFILLAIATRTWSETVVIAVVGALSQSLWRPKTRPSAIQLLFNAATMAIAGGLTYTVAKSLVAGSTLESDIVVLILGVSGVILLVTNTLIVSTICV